MSQQRVYVPPYNLTKTLLCTYHELGIISPFNFNWVPEDTINTKYNILPESIPSSQPKLKYFGIGIRGFKNLDTAQLSAPYVPAPDNEDLYTPIPFRIVPVSDDLNPTERASYRMRVRTTIDGNEYFCYYLKVLNYLSNELKILDINLDTKIETEIEEFDHSKLNPEPTITSNIGTTEYTSERIVTMDANALITGEEVLESTGVLYSSIPYAAKISEIGLYFGEDISHTVDGVDYTEVIYSFLGYHLTWNGSDLNDPAASLTRKFRISSSSAYLL